MNECDEIDTLLESLGPELRYRDRDPWADQRMERNVRERMGRTNSTLDLLAGWMGYGFAAASALLAVSGVFAFRLATEALELSLLGDPELIGRLLLTGGF